MRGLIGVNPFQDIGIVLMLIFFLLFIGLALFVYLPSRLQLYRRIERFPLDDDR